MTTLDDASAPPTEMPGQLALEGFDPPPPGPDDEPTVAAPTTGWRTVRTVFLVLVAVALVSRLAALGSRPLHHDESLDAWFSWRYLNGTYEGYDPVYHGPLRFYITAWFYWLLGESEAVARLLPALSGVVVVALPWFWRRDLGKAGTIGAVVLLTVSPSMLYFSRFGREDAFFLALTFGAMITLVAFLRRPKWWHPTLILALVVCAWAVKESIFLSIFVVGSFGMVLMIQDFITAKPPGEHSLSGSRALSDDMVKRITLVLGLVCMIAAFAIIGVDPERDLDAAGEPIGLDPTFLWLGGLGGLYALGIILAWFDSNRRGVRLTDVRVFGSIATAGWKGWSIAVGVSIFLFVGLFSQFFRDFSGPGSEAAPHGAIRNGLTAGFEYWLGEQDTVRGDARWQYYLAVIPAYEWMVLALAFVGIVRVLRRPTLLGQVLVWWGVSSFAVHSWAGERMPWLIIHPLLPFVLLAGYGLQGIWGRRTSMATVVAVPIAAALALGLVVTAVSSYQAAYVRGGEPQELFVQAGQATPEVPEWTERLELLNQLSVAEFGRNATVSIDADVFWPYGWYLRDYPGGTYAIIDPAEVPPDSDVIFVPHWKQQQVGDQLEGYVAIPYEHRWWWVPDLDASGGFGEPGTVAKAWLNWVWDREPWQASDNAAANSCPGSLVGQVYMRAELFELEQRYRNGEPPPAADKPDYDGPCQRLD